MIYLRKAEPEDVDILFEWANDPLVRENSFHTEQIPYEEHKRWFGGMMSNPKVFQYILMEEDIPCGQIRLNVQDDTAEIGYSIAPQYRGRGYGRRILQLMAEEVKQNHPEIRTLVAKVKLNNPASVKLFESEHYELEYLCYSLNTRR